MNILVVDDEPENLELIRHLLENERITFHCVASGEQAIGKIEQGTFLLMITDLNMPGQNGLDLAKTAREIAPDMPIIMITGSILPELYTLAAEAGIAKVLAKPFHPNQMLETVREVLEV